MNDSAAHNKNNINNVKEDNIKSQLINNNQMKML